MVTMTVTPTILTMTSTGSTITLTSTGSTITFNIATILPSNAAKVTGPALAVDSHVAVFDGITGKLIKDSGINLSSKKTDNVSATSRVLGRKSADAGVIEELTAAELLVLAGLNISLTTPLIIGGANVGSKLTYKSTTGVGTPTGIAHQFLGGTNGATVIATLLNNGNVGIGVINPVKRFEISSDQNNDGIDLKKGSNSFAQLIHVSSTDDGLLRLYSEGVIKIQIYSNGDSYINAGNVGIGTVLAGAGVTYRKLNVNGSELFVGADSTQESPMLQIVPSYVVNTHASYTTRTVISQWAIGGAQEVLRFESGAAAKISFLGAVAVARQTGIAAQKINYTTGDLDTEAEIITALNTTNAAINALRTALNNLGLTTIV